MNRESFHEFNAAKNDKMFFPSQLIEIYEKKILAENKWFGNHTFTKRKRINKRMEYENL